MKKALLLVALCVFSGTVFGGDKKDKAQRPMSDAQFVLKAAMGSMMEVRLGELAMQKGDGQAVKDFGKMMVTDHSQASQELKELASNKGITLPTDLDQKHQQKLERLSALSGAEFDRAYMSEMVQDHEKDIKLFERQANSGKDEEVKQWAAGKLAKLKEHQQMAADTRQQVGGGKAE